MTKEETNRGKLETPEEVDPPSTERKDENPLSQDEEEKIKKRLRDLGYIE